jgi:hypothetical protein
MGVAPAATKLSTECTSASMPADTVASRGQLSVRSGSRSASTGRYFSVLIPPLRFSRLSVKTAFGVTSLPVPAVVGIATTGIPGSVTRSKPRYSIAGLGFVTSTDTALVRSRMLPPPTATRRSALGSRRVRNSSR